jgi:hypothetical protein
LSVSGAVVREDRHFINHYAESRGERAASCQLRMVADEPAQDEDYVVGIM